jgi:hypothetical protein
MKESLKHIKVFNHYGLYGFTFYTLVIKGTLHKKDNFFGFDFEFCTISLLVMHK